MSQKNKFRTAIILIISVVCAVVFFRIYSNIRAKKAFMSDSRNDTPVEVVKAVRGEIEKRLILTGTVYPRAEVVVFSKIPGKLEKVYVDLGDRVKKGQLLAVIEHKDLSLQVEQAEASLAVANANLEQAKVNLKTAREDFERIKPLFEDGAISRQQYDSALSKYDNSKSQLMLAEAQANNLQTATLNLAKERLADSQIKAPINGIITLRNYNAGAMVATSTSSISNALLKIEDIETVKVLANVAESDLSEIKIGLKALVTVTAFPGEVFTGKISKITPSVDIATRTSAVGIEIPNKENKLKSGFFANIILTVSKISDALLVPKNAVLSKYGKNIAFVFNGGFAHLKQIETGLQDDKNIQVLKGLKEGDDVIITEIYALENGAKVRKEKL